MTKKYAIVQPAFTFSGDGFGDLPWLFVTPFHKITYEQICGYSLGHKVIFYDDLSSAQKYFDKGKDRYSNFYARQNAIIELDFEKNRITNFFKIYEITGTVEKFKKCEDSEYFEKVRLPKWKEQLITPTDFTRGAINEMNRQYYNLKEQKEEKISPIRQDTHNKLGIFSKSAVNNKDEHSSQLPKPARCSI